MILAVRSIRSQFSSFSSSSIPSSLFASWHQSHTTLRPSTLNRTFSLSSTRNPSRRGRRRKNNFGNPPLLDQSQIDAAIASLPPRFTPSVLSDALSRLPDPRHCIPLLLHSINHRTHLLRSGDASAVSPFLTAVKRLGAARLYREMDSAASLAFSFPSPPSPNPSSTPSSTSTQRPVGSRKPLASTSACAPPPPPQGPLPAPSTSSSPPSSPTAAPTPTSTISTWTHSAPSFAKCLTLAYPLTPSPSTP